MFVLIYFIAMFSQQQDGVATTFSFQLSNCVDGVFLKLMGEHRPRTLAAVGAKFVVKTQKQFLKATKSPTHPNMPKHLQIYSNMLWFFCVLGFLRCQ